MTKINEKTLLDAWTVTGTDYEEFKSYLNELSECTEFVKVNPAEVSILSLVSFNDGEARFWDLAPCNTGAPQKVINTRVLRTNKVMELGNHEQLLKETLENVKALFFSGRKVLFPSIRVFTKGMVQFGLGGQAMDKPRFERDLYVSAAFKDAPQSTFVLREISGVKKLFAILSSKYKSLPQSALCEIIEALDISDFGEMKVYRWTLDNFTANIYVEFPQKAEEISDYYGFKDKFIPGLWLQTSDTGDASVKVFPTWRCRGSINYIEKASVKKVHSGKVELSDLVGEVQKKAFSEYTRLPEALCNLMSQTLTDESLDLSNPTDIGKNRSNIEKVIKKAFKTLGIAKAIGIKNKQSLQEQVLSEFAGDIPYTAYDIATCFLSLPERLEGVCAATLHNLEAAVSEAPYIKYSVSAKDEESEEDLVLI